MHKVLVIFEQIAKIPHGSYNEKALSDFARDYAEECGCEVIQDDALNIIIKVSGSAGFEESNPIILQGHLDMICEKQPGSTHDFLRDPIPLVYDGDILRADGTTLGADNAIAIAYCLALLDEGSPHPPLEILLTVEEEVSMKGVKEFDPAQFSGRTLINLDSSGEGVLTVSCAGGVAVDFTAHIPLVSGSGGQGYQLVIDGLQGGHSGGEIHMERANANKLLCRVLFELINKTGLGVASINGGTKTNAIPVEARAVVVPTEDISERVAQWQKVLRDEYSGSDKDVRLSLIEQETPVDKLFEREALLRLLGGVIATPCGSQRRDLELGIVVLSNSMGIIRTQGEEVLVCNSLRGNSDSMLDELIQQVCLTAEAFGLETEVSTRYPGWAYNPKSPIREATVAAWRELHGSEPEIAAIHAGLEVGYIAEKLPGLDAVSFGPNTTGGHTPQEQLSVASFISTYELLLETLRRLA